MKKKKKTNIFLLVFKLWQNPNICTQIEKISDALTEYSFTQKQTMAALTLLLRKITAQADITHVK